MDENNNHNQMDFGKLMEQASAFSRMLQSGGASDNPDANSGNGDNMSRIMEAVQLFKTMNGPGDESRQNSATTPECDNSSPFDERLYTPTLQAMKAAIPFLDYRYQKNMGIFVKLIEIHKIMELYGGPNAVFIQSASGKNWQCGLLQAVRPHMDCEKQNVLDLIIKLMEINEILMVMRKSNRHAPI